MKRLLIESFLLSLLIVMASIVSISIDSLIPFLGTFLLCTGYAMIAYNWKSD